MFLINILISIPLPGQKRVLLTYDLAIEESGQRRILISESIDLQIAAQVRILLVDMLCAGKAIASVTSNQGHIKARETYVRANVFIAAAITSQNTHHNHPPIPELHKTRSMGVRCAANTTTTNCRN